MKCLYHTEGENCHLCRQGYYGSALQQDCRSEWGDVAVSTLPAMSWGGSGCLSSFEFTWEHLGWKGNLITSSWSCVRLPCCSVRLLARTGVLYICQGEQGQHLHVLKGGGFCRRRVTCPLVSGLCFPSSSEMAGGRVRVWVLLTPAFLQMWLGSGTESCPVS